MGVCSSYNQCIMPIHSKLIIFQLPGGTSYLDDPPFDTERTVYMTLIVFDDCDNHENLYDQLATFGKTPDQCTIIQPNNMDICDTDHVNKWLFTNDQDTVMVIRVY